MLFDGITTYDNLSTIKILSISFAGKVSHFTISLFSNKTIILAPILNKIYQYEVTTFSLSWQYVILCQNVELTKINRWRSCRRYSSASQMKIQGELNISSNKGKVRSNKFKIPAKIS
jgi:hypothetical protein